MVIVNQFKVFVNINSQLVILNILGKIKFQFVEWVSLLLNVFVGFDGNFAASHLVAIGFEKTSQRCCTCFIEANLKNFRARHGTAEYFSILRDPLRKSD